MAALLFSSVMETKQSNGIPEHGQREKKMSRREKKQHRDCEDCIAYYNMLGGKEYRCGLGFQVAEEIETDELQRWHMYVRPYQDECEIVPQPKTKEELVMTARSLGIEWDIDEVLDLGECIFE